MIQYITRQPTDDEVNLMKLAMSTSCDGSGQEREKDGSGTRPGWREYERILVELIGGYGPENKDVFDVVVESTERPGSFYGISAKSKELSRSSAIGDLAGAGRVYMELCNSPAKLWSPLTAKGIHESDFHGQKRAQEMGETLIETVQGWHEEAKANFEAANAGMTLDLARSIFLVISYSKKEKLADPPRNFQFHSFDLDFPKGIRWAYSSARCLRGFDPKHPTEALFDWYGLSGGQLKYYPRAQYHRHCGAPFTLLTPREVSIIEKAANYWPVEWARSGGEVTLTLPEFAEEIGKRAELFDNDRAKDILREAVRQLLALE